MGFGSEKLDVYRAIIEYIDWALRLCDRMKIHRKANGIDTEGTPLRRDCSTKAEFATPTAV